MTVKKVFGLLTLIVLIASLGTVGFGTMQHAWASPGALCATATPVIGPTDFFSWTCWGDPSTIPHTGGVTVVWRTLDAASVADTDVSFAPDCTPSVDPFPTGGSDGFTDAFLFDNTFLLGPTPNFYSITDATGSPPLPIGAGEETITWFFPSGPAGIITSITSDGVAPPITLSAPLDQGWFQIGSNPDATPALSLGSWRMETCAIDGPTGTAGGDFDPFVVRILVVAGEILPIDTTALLITAAKQNVIWILSSLVVVAGVSFALLRVQFYSKSN